MAGGAGSGFRSIPCQCTGLKIPSFCCLTVLYGHSRGWMYAEVGRAPWCSYFAVQIILAELLEYHNAQRWVRMLAWQFRLMSAAGWMFRIISAVMFGCFVLIHIFLIRVAVKCLWWLVGGVYQEYERSSCVDIGQDGLVMEGWSLIWRVKGGHSARGQCIAQNRPSVLGFDHQTGAVEGMCDSSGFTEKALSEVFLKVLSFSTSISFYIQ